MVLFLASLGAGFALHHVLLSHLLPNLLRRPFCRWLTAAVLFFFFVAFLVGELSNSLPSVLGTQLIPIFLGGFVGFSFAQWIRFLRAFPSDSKSRNALIVWGGALALVAVLGLFHETFMKMSKTAQQLSAFGFSIDLRTDSSVSAESKLAVSGAADGTAAAYGNFYHKGLDKLADLELVWDRDIAYINQIKELTSNRQSVVARHRHSKSTPPEIKAKHFPLPQKTLDVFRWIKCIRDFYLHHGDELRREAAIPSVLDAHIAWHADGSVEKLETQYEIVGKRLEQLIVYYNIDLGECRSVEGDPRPDRYSLHATLALAYWFQLAELPRSAAFVIQSWINRNQRSADDGGLWLQIRARMERSRILRGLNMLDAIVESEKETEILLDRLFKKTFGQDKSIEEMTKRCDSTLPNRDEISVQFAKRLAFIYTTLVNSYVHHSRLHLGYVDKELLETARLLREIRQSCITITNTPSDELIARYFKAVFLHTYSEVLFDAAWQPRSSGGFSVHDVERFARSAIKHVLETIKIYEEFVEMKDLDDNFKEDIHTKLAAARQLHWQMGRQRGGQGT